MVTDGTSFWVVDGSALKVFKYTLSGSLLGNWTIDPANTHPTGITINPTNVSDVWIVDSGTLKVYDYTAAASRTSGSQNAGATFALAAGDTNPQGIADPPPADMLPTPAVAPLPLDEPSVAVVDTASSVGLSPVASATSGGGRDTAFALLAGVPLPATGANAANLTTGEALPSWLAGMRPSIPVSNQWFGPDHGAVAAREGTRADEESEASTATTDTVFAGLADDAATEK
jgi:hypothetical protein